MVETSKKKRHTSFSLRSPEATASIRHVSMTKERVGNFFLAERKQFTARAHLEHGRDRAHKAHKPGKVVAEKGGKKQFMPNVPLSDNLSL